MLHIERYIEGYLHLKLFYIAFNKDGQNIGSLLAQIHISMASKSLTIWTITYMMNVDRNDSHGVDISLSFPLDLMVLKYGNA